MSTAPAVLPRVKTGYSQNSVTARKKENPLQAKADNRLKQHRPGVGSIIVLKGIKTAVGGKRATQNKYAAPGTIFLDFVA